MTQPLNIALQLPSLAAEMGHHPCIICRDEVLSYEELEEQSNQCMRGLHQLGVEKGTRVVMMLEPGIEFTILSFSLLKLAAIIVFVDPRMGRTNLAGCLADVAPEVFIGSLQAHIARIALNWARDTLRLHISVSEARIPGTVTLGEVMRRGGVVQSVPMPSLGLDEPAAVVFTSGSTGAPKGVIYTHRMFSAQVDFLKDNFQIMSKEVDVITFPLFAFFNPVMRVTSVFPRIDFTRPARADPIVLCRALQANQATHMFGSPALLDRLSRYGVRQTIKL